MAMNKDFGGFELREKIGAGGMASVYLAQQKSLQRPVVLKILYPHLAEDEKLVQRFEREARAAAMMRHENIIQVIDCGRYDDVAYIAMEFVEGMDLKKWLEAHGTPPVEMALLMVRDICRGLEHAHGHRIVHRDIKPANVMLTPDGTIKIMDFGLARSGVESTTQVTMVGSVLGTPAYMSPEQATGEMVDERSDIFSLGVVAYELLGGRRPFSGDSYSTVLRSILTVEPPPLDHFNPLVADELVEIVRRMLTKDVSKRYSDIRQVRGEFENIIEQLGLLRGKDLLREYALDPEKVGETWRAKRLSRHLDQGLFYENMGLGKIDDALKEFRRVLHLDPRNKVAQEHVQQLEREREKLVAAQGTSPGAGPAAEPASAMHDDGTMVMAPGVAQAAMSLPAPPAPAAPAANDDRTMVLPPGATLPNPPASPPEDHTMVLTPGMAAPPAPKPPSPKPPVPASPPPSAPKPAPAPRPAPVRPAPAPAKRGGPPMPAIVGGVLAVAVAIAAAVMLNRPKPEPESPVLAGTTAPDIPATTPDSTLGSGSTTPRIEPPPEIPPKPKPTSSKASAGGSAKNATDPATGKPATEEPPKEPPAGKGTLIATVEPYADIVVDGKVEARGQNQPRYRFELPSGTYSVTATHPDYGKKTWTVEIEPGATKTLAYDFIRSSSGSIHVSSGGDWAEIWIDGENTGQTTPKLIEGVPPGDRTVSVRREGFQVEEGGSRTVKVRPGERVSVVFKLKPKK